MSAEPTTAREALDALSGMPFGAERLALAERAVRMADQERDDDLAYLARMNLTSAAHWMDDYETMLPSYGWCVAQHDRDPQRFLLDPGLEEGADLLFQGKWMAGALAENSGMPRARIDQVVDDLERRFREAGASMHGLLQVRRDLAVSSGAIDEAVRITAERDAHPVDDHSHCDACVRSSDVDLALETGDDEGAIRLWEQIHEGGYSCGEEPEVVDATILLALLRAGRHEEALAAHARSYRMMQRFHPEAMLFSRHLPFLAVTGNLDRGLDILEHHLRALGGSPFAEHMTFGALVDVAVLLDALFDAGHGALSVRGSDDAGLRRLLGHEARLDVAALRERVWATAEALGARFDERDGADGAARRLARARSLRGTRHDLPYGGGVFRPGPSADVAEPADARGWLFASRRCTAVGDERGAAQAADRALDGGDDIVTAHVLGDRIRRSLAAGDGEGARGLLAERIARLRTAGAAAKAASEERTGIALFAPADAGAIAALEAELPVVTDGDARAHVLVALAVASRLAEGAVGDRTPMAERALSLTGEAIAGLSADDPHLVFLDAAEERMNALLVLERYDDAVALSATAIADGRVAGQPTQELRRLRAVALAYAGRLDEAGALADELLSDLGGGEGRSAYVASVAQMAATLHAQLGRPAEAVARLEHAKRLLERAEEPTRPIVWQLANAQEAAGFFHAALESFEQVYLEEREAQLPPAEIAVTLARLAGAARRANEPALAYRSLVEGLELAEESGEPLLVRDIGTELGQLLRAYDDADAVGVFGRVLEVARGIEEPEPWSVVNALHHLGSARMRFGDPDGDRDLTEAATLVAGFGTDATAIDIEISRGLGWNALGEEERALDVLTRAADRAAEEDRGLAATANLHVASLLHNLARPVEAEVRYRRALDQAEPQTVVRFHATNGLASLLEEQGRVEEAEALRADLA